MAKRTNELNCRLFVVVLVITFWECCSSSDVSSQSPPVGRSIEDIGNPRTDVGSCGRNQPSYICDPDHVLLGGQDDALESQISSIYNSTRCPCSDALCMSTKSGYLITIAIINKMKLTANPTDNSATDQNDEHASHLDTVLSEARKLASGLLKKWNLGRCSESILILFSRADNVLYTVTDVVAEKKLTDDLIGEISMDVRSEFGQNVTSGFQKLLTEYKEVFDGTYKRKTNWEDNNNMPKYYPVIGASGNSLCVYIYIYTLVTVVVTVLMQL